MRGLDYWPHLNYEVYENFEDFLEKNPDCIGKLYMATTKARHIYTEVAYEPDSYLMFGKESAGIPEEILVKIRRLLYAYPDGIQHTFIELEQFSGHCAV